MTVTETMTQNVARWARRHNVDAMTDRYSLGEAIAEDGLTATEAFDMLQAAEVEITSGIIREVIVVQTGVSSDEFTRIKGQFHSWSALYEWVRAGGDRRLLNILPLPIKVDTLRQHYGSKTTRPRPGAKTASSVSTEDLLAELNARMDDDKIVGQVIDTAVKASTRNAKRRDATKGKSPTPKVPQTTAGLEGVAAMQSIANLMRKADDHIGELPDAALDAVRAIFEREVVPAYGSLSLTILGATRI